MQILNERFWSWSLYFLQSDFSHQNIRVELRRSENEELIMLKFIKRPPSFGRERGDNLLSVIQKKCEVSLWSSDYFLAGITVITLCLMLMVL